MITVDQMLADATSMSLLTDTWWATFEEGCSTELIDTVTGRTVNSILRVGDHYTFTPPAKRQYEMTHPLRFRSLQELYPILCDCYPNHKISFPPALMPYRPKKNFGGGFFELA